MVLNCDIVIASDEAVFATPEVKRGVVAAMGGLCSQMSRTKLHLTSKVSQSFQGLLGRPATSWLPRCCFLADLYRHTRLPHVSACESCLPCKCGLFLTARLV